MNDTQNNEDPSWVRKMKELWLNVWIAICWAGLQPDAPKKKECLHLHQRGGSLQWTARGWCVQLDITPTYSRFDVTELQSDPKRGPRYCVLVVPVETGPEESLQAAMSRAAVSAVRGAATAVGAKGVKV